MSKKRQVRSLHDHSLEEYANLIVSTMTYVNYKEDSMKDINIVIVDIHQYMDTAGATSNVYEDLLRCILCSDNVMAGIRFDCLQMLLNGGVWSLRTEVFPFSYYDKILQVIAAQGTGLRILNLKGVWVKEEQMHYMFEIVKTCEHLTKLYVPYIANDDLLETIGKYCKKLRLLDISGETDITEVGIESISKGVCAKHLTKIDIGTPGEENICHTDVALILENCPNVETLSTYAFVGRALKFIYDNIDDNFKCRLKYLHDTNSDKDTLHAIKCTCPQLESLYLDAPLIGCLYELCSITLSKLKLHRFCSSELMQILESIGNSLRCLTIIKGIGDFNLNRLAYICPSLVELNCYLMDNLHYDGNHHRFRDLKGLEILSSTITNNSLKTLISSATQLKRLAIDRITLNDEDIISIFVENDFYQIEDIWFTLAPHLSLQSIEIFIERCPELQTIGQLSGWSISHEDMAYLSALLRSENSSLTLAPNGFYP